MAKGANQAYQRTIHEIDAAGCSIGRVASLAVLFLLGKHKPSFEPRIDNGETVIIHNAGKALFTGRKLAQKDFYRHTMYPGGLKRTPLKRIFERNPGQVIRRAIEGMLPKNNRRKLLLRRLTVLP